jgi:hypothetical protein
MLRQLIGQVFLDVEAILQGLKYPYLGAYYI